MSNSTPTHHLALKSAMQRIDAAWERQKLARARYEDSGLASDKDAIETACISRRRAYEDLRDTVEALIQGGH